MVKPRESKTNLNEMIGKLSGIQDRGQLGFQVESLLCLANEIKKLKEENKKLNKLLILKDVFNTAVKICGAYKESESKKKTFDEKLNELRKKKND